MIYKRIKDFPPKQVGTYTGEELTLISDTLYNAKVKLSELREFILTGSGLLYSGGEGILNVTGSAIISGDLSINGDLNVQNINQINVDNLKIKDKNIILNASGTNSTSSGSGLIIEGTSGSVLSRLSYIPSFSSSWGLDGREIVNVSSTQSLSNKTLSSPYILNSTLYTIQSRTFLTGSFPTIPSDKSFCFISSSNFSASLPPITNNLDGYAINIKNYSDSDLMISASAGQSIDQFGGITLRYMDSIQLFSDFQNNRWWTFNYSTGNSTIIL